MNRANLPVLGYIATVLAAAVAAVPVAAQTPANPQRGPDLYRGGNCAEAIGPLGAAVATGGLALARCDVESGDYMHALDAVTGYRVANPADVAAIGLQAQILLKLERGADVPPMIEEFLKQYPEQVPVRDALGDVFAAMGDSAKASGEYKKVLETWPGDPGAHIGLAELAEQDNRWQDAVAEFDKAKAVVPNDFRLLTGTGRAYVQLGDCAKAEPPLHNALKLAPDRLPIAKMVAKCGVETGNWQDVLAALQTGTVAEAADEEATAMAALAFENLKQNAEAEKYFGAVIKLNPSNYTAHIDLADRLYSSTSPTELVKEAALLKQVQAEYQSAIGLHPELPARVQERLGDLDTATGKSADARRQYEAAVKQKDATDELRWKLAQNCFEGGDTMCANRVLATIASDEYGLRVKSLRAQIAFGGQDWDQAGALANQVLEASPNHSDLTMLRIAAEVARRQNKPKDAAELYEKAVKLDPADRETRRRLVGVYLESDELNGAGRAIELLSEYLNQIKKDPEFDLLLASAYDSRHDIENARLYYKTGLDQIAPPIPKQFSWALNAYGYLLVNEDKNYKEAYTQLTRAVELNPTDEGALYNLALTCLELDKTDELQEYRTKLQDLNSSKLADLDLAIDKHQKKAEDKPDTTERKR